MGVPRTAKTIQRKYFQKLEEIIERNPHQIHVIQERRALRDEARRIGIDFLVGDLKEPPSVKSIAKKHGVTVPYVIKQLHAGTKIEMEHTKDKKTAQTIASHHLWETPKYYIKLKKVEKSQSHFISLEKAEKGEDVYPHKYVEKYTTPSGHVVYIYADDLKHRKGPKSTGFEGKAEPKGPPSELGAKRTRVSGEVKEAHPEIQARTLQGLEGRESTQRAMVLASKHLGGLDKFEEGIKRVFESNPHLDVKEHRHHMVEAYAKSILLAHPELDVVKPHTGKEAITGRFKNVAGGVMHPDVRQRQPWQLTSKQFDERKKVEPELGGKTHEGIVSEAHERGEYIPAKVLEEHPPIREDYLKNRGALELSPETAEYVSKFDKLVKSMPTSFDSWVKPDLKNLGDDLLISEKTSGYNIDSYDVTDRGIYSHMMTADKDVVLYHMYAQHTDHGREMLAIMHEKGLDPQYTVVKRASAVKWHDSWGPLDKEVTSRDIGGGGKIAYSSDYILAFKPKDKEQAEKIYNTLHKYGNMKYSDHSIPESYDVPDVRSSQKVDDFEKVYLNVFQKGSQELTVLTKNDWIREEGPAVSREEARRPEPREYHKGGMLRDHVWIERKQSREEQEKEAPPFLAQVIKSHANEFGEVLLVRLEK